MKIVTCPVDSCIKCGKEGRLNPYRRSGPNITHYYVGHEGRGYYWGTSHKQSEQVEAIDRCYLEKPFQIKWAKKMLGEEVDNEDEGLMKYGINQ